MHAILQITWLLFTAATMWPLLLPAFTILLGVQGWVITYHCGHSGFIAATWAPCPVPLVMCLSQPLVQTHLSHPYLCHLMIVMGTAPFCRASKPPCPWRTRRKRKTRCPHPSVPGPSQDHMAAVTLEIKNTDLFTWRPLPLWGKPAPSLLSMYFLLYITVLVGSSQSFSSTNH